MGGRLLIDHKPVHCLSNVNEWGHRPQLDQGQPGPVSGSNELRREGFILARCLQCQGGNVPACQAAYIQLLLLQGKCQQRRPAGQQQLPAAKKWGNLKHLA